MLRLLLLCLAGCCFSVALSSSASPSFVIQGNSFVKDGEPVVLLSGSFHFFRVHPSDWTDRLTKMRNCGLNAVQTYIPWNLHNPQPGVFNFDGFLDIVSFLQQAQAVGLMVILRPGPYSCAEWEFGGIPYWVNNLNTNVRIRSSDPDFMGAVADYFNVLLPKLKPLIYANGGPVVLVQVENEYGSFGNDKAYLMGIVDLYRSNLGSNVVLHSTDGASDSMLTGTYLGSTVYQTVDFGVNTDVNQQFAMQRKYQPTGPLMNSEYYTGWFTHWGDSAMASVDTNDIVSGYTAQLALNASVNFYMFVGSTNFGFHNGANLFSTPDDYGSVVTSYDYDSPIAENGTLREKWYAIQKAISQFYPIPPPQPTKPTQIADYGSVAMSGQANLFDTLDTLSTPVTSGVPLTFEQLGQAFGFVLYRTGIYFGGSLQLQQVRERAYVFVNQELVGILSRNISAPDSLSLNVPLIPPTSPAVPLDILVENQGRVNYGQWMNGRQGITDGVRIGQQFQNNFTIYGLPLLNLTSSSLRTGPVKSTTGPAFYTASFSISGAPQDTYVDMTGWGKGQIFINGFNVGRYWSTMGPQYSFWVPAAVLQQGSNDMVIFELESTTTTSVRLVSQFITATVDRHEAIAATKRKVANSRHWLA